MRRARSTSDTSLLFNLEIEKFCKANKKETRKRKEALRETELEADMADERIRIGGGNAGNGQNNENGAQGEEIINANVPRGSMMDHAFPRFDDLRESIARPRIDANSYKMDFGVLQMIQNSQFGGHPSENPHTHLKKFAMICDMQKQPGVSDDAARLKLFPFSLKDRALDWLDSLPHNSITNWEQLTDAFLAQYFPPGKTQELRNQMTAFRPREDETLYESWMRWKELERQCPHYAIPKWMINQNFYTNVTPTIRGIIDAQTGGEFIMKHEDEAYELLEKITKNTHLWSSPRGPALTQKRQATGMYDLDPFNMINAKFDALTNVLAKKMEDLSMLVSSSSSSESSQQVTYAEGTTSCGVDYGEQAAYVGNYGNKQMGNPYSQTYNPTWRNHPNFSWGNQQNQVPNQNLQPQQQQGIPYQQNRQPLPNFQQRNMNPPPKQ